MEARKVNQLLVVGPGGQLVGALNIMTCFAPRPFDATWPTSLPPTCSSASSPTTWLL